MVGVDAEQQASEEQQLVPLVKVLNHVIDKSDIRRGDAEDHQNERDEGRESGNRSDNDTGEQSNDEYHNR